MNPTVCQHCSGAKGDWCGDQHVHFSFLSSSDMASMKSECKSHANKHIPSHKLLFCFLACPSQMALLGPSLVAQGMEMGKGRSCDLHLRIPSPESWDYYPHVTDKEMEAQRGKTTWVLPSKCRATIRSCLLTGHHKKWSRNSQVCELLHHKQSWTELPTIPKSGHANLPALGGWR